MKTCKIIRYSLDLKYQQGKKMFVSYVLPRLHIEAQENVHDVMFKHFVHLSKVHIYHNYKHLAYTIHKHNAKQQEQKSIKPRRGRIPKTTKHPKP